MPTRYAEISDITLFRTLTPQEQTIAESLLDTASAQLRVIGKKYGVDIEEKTAADEDFKLVVKNTVIQAVLRALAQCGEQAAQQGAAVQQATQSAMGYSASVTFVNPGLLRFYKKIPLRMKNGEVKNIKL